MIPLYLEAKGGLAIKVMNSVSYNVSIGTMGFRNASFDAVYSRDGVWMDADGSIGIGNSKSSGNFGRFMMDRFPEGKFAITMQTNGTSLIFGDLMNNLEIEWSEAQYDASPWYKDASKNGNQLIFPIYNLSICNAPLLPNVSHVWRANINTMIQGIRVPAEMFDLINSWFLNATVETWNVNTILPVLKFSLVDGGIEYKIPLNAIWDQLSREFHLSKGDQMKWHFYRTGLLTTGPTIEFGTRIIEYLDIAFDLKTNRIGLAQTSSPIPSPNFCQNRTSCYGDQWYFSGSNTCIDPICPYFKRVDSTSKQCVIRLELYIILVLLFLMLFVYEVIVYYAYHRASLHLDEQLNSQ